MYLIFPHMRSTVQSPWHIICSIVPEWFCLWYEQLHFIKETLNPSFIELSPSWGTINCAATEEILSILWNLKVHYCVHESHPLVPILSQGICLGPMFFAIFRNKLIVYSEEDHPLSSVCDCLFNIFAATLHIWRSSPPSATWGCPIPWWQGTRLIWHQRDRSVKLKLRKLTTTIM
jgi:hypothetical protein